jgi:hypothetical protein
MQWTFASRANPPNEARAGISEARAPDKTALEKRKVEKNERRAKLKGKK